MSLSDAVVGTVVWTRNGTLKLVADLSDEQLALQPAPKTNHAAWVLGHLITTDYALLGILTGQAVPAWIDEAFKAKYGNKSEPVAEKENYQNKAVLCGAAECDAHEQIIAKLEDHDGGGFLHAAPGSGAAGAVCDDWARCALLWNLA